MATSNLMSMLGTGITDRTVFQWVKIFGRDNIFFDNTKSDYPLVNRDYLAKVFYDSKEQGRTTNALANIMLYAYYGWVQKPENTRITGYMAEEIHNRVMRSISMYWNRPWKPDKHKCPIYGIINLFNIIRRYVQADLLPPLNGKTCPGKGKMKATKEMVDSWELGVDMAALDARSTCGVSSDSLFENYMDSNHSIAQWDTFHGKTPLEILIQKEAGNGV